MEYNRFLINFFLFILNPLFYECTFLKVCTTFSDSHLGTLKLFTQWTSTFLWSLMAKDTGYRVESRCINKKLAQSFSGTSTDIKGWKIILRDSLKSCNVSCISHPCCLNASSTFPIILTTPNLPPCQLPPAVILAWFKSQVCTLSSIYPRPFRVVLYLLRNNSQLCPLFLKTLFKTGPVIAS